MRLTAARRWGLTLVVAALAAIAAATLQPSADAASHTPLGCLLCGDQGAADAIVNVILFMPLGVGLALLGLRPRAAVPLGLLASVLVELAQYSVVAGRDASLGDVVFNTAGTALGFGLGPLLLRLVRLDDRPAGRLALALSLVVALGVALTGWLLQPSFPSGESWGHWTPRLDRFEWYRGQVLSARIADREVPSRQLADPEWLRAALRAGAPIEVRYVGGPAVSGLASLFNVSDEALRNFVLIGPDRRDLVFQYRARAVEVLLDQPDIRIPGGWTVGAGEPGLVRVSSPEPGAWCLENTGIDPTCLGFTLGSAWGLLYYAEMFPPWFRTLLSAGWAAGLALPVGLLARRRGTSGAALMVLILAALVVPGVVGLRPTPVTEWAGLAVGAAAGLVAAGLLRRVGPAGVAGH